MKEPYVKIEKKEDGDWSWSIWQNRFWPRLLDDGTGFSKSDAEHKAVVALKQRNWTYAKKETLPASKLLQRVDSEFEDDRFFIDRSGFSLDCAGNGLTGAEIRNIPSPSISEDYDLWLQTPEGRNDALITANLTVPIRAGTRFFTVPRSIRAGIV